MPIERTGQWVQARAILRGASSMVRPMIQKAVLQEAHFFRRKIVQGIREQAPGGRKFAPLSPNTLRVRKAQKFRGTKALIRTGGLRNSITVKRVGDGAFVGVLRSARSKTGGSLANIADIHENGRGPFLVPITNKSRRFLNAVGIDPHPGPRFAVVRIPARPFIGPVFEKFGKPEMSRRRILRRLSILLGRRFGSV